ncbi:hypothetical protein [Halorhabdus salina]|uniref:hypothetical protein n=1 Tax=Halorhabdus salina TaxID=2750670 RepID=UPI0015EF1079|nr:hypothetical protein [Halorhabdus salina]
MNMTDRSASTASSDVLETKACHVLAETTPSVQDRISCLVLLLGGPKAIDDALVTFVEAGEQHVLIDKYRRFVHLERYCERLSVSYEITLHRLLARTVNNEGTTNLLRPTIESADRLSTEQTDHRLSLLNSIEQSSSSHTVDQSQQDAFGSNLSEKENTATQDDTPIETLAETNSNASGERGRSRDSDCDGSSNKSVRDDIASTTGQMSDDNKLRSGEQSTKNDTAPTDEQSGGPQSDSISHGLPTDPPAAHSISSTPLETGTATDTDSQEPPNHSPEHAKSDGMGIDQEPDDRHRGNINPPQRSDPTETGSMSVSNYAQDLVSFDFVLDSNDESVPNDVQAGGLIKLDEKQYAGIARVHPRTWSIHTNEKKAEIVGAYKSSFLATLDFPIQIVSYPTHFDISDHLERLQSVRDLSEDDYGDSGLADIGRSLYPEWFKQFLSDNDMKQREFYIIAPTSAEQIDQFRSDDDGFWNSLADSFPPAEPVAAFFGDDSESISTQQLLRELDSRLNRISSGLQRFGVQSERLTDRNEVMAILHHYYNNEKPLTNKFPEGIQIDAEPFDFDSSNVGADDT